MSYTVDDWVFDKRSGQTGICLVRNWYHTIIQVGPFILQRYPDEVELAPVSLSNEDYIELQHLAVNLNDKEWFTEIGERMVRT